MVNSQDRSCKALDSAYWALFLRCHQLVVRVLSQQADCIKTSQISAIRPDLYGNTDMPPPAGSVELDGFHHHLTQTKLDSKQKREGKEKKMCYHVQE